MRHGTPNRRSRNRGNGGRRGNQPRAQVFDSNGPDVRIRGTAYQVHEKYMNLAKDASSQGDLVLAESYLQHAEHYQRLINSWGDSDTSDARAYDEGEDDLGLPSSIVGKGAGERSQAVARQDEFADA
ncbi:MAG: DUF4167 domain-containing protein [Alphaproteobacteria bacterium]|nr:DUF4167 domain-containing protein [Alphaproteobacteria bacterium]